MADDRLKFIFETLGLEELNSKIEVFYRLAEKAGAVDFKKMQRSIKAVSQEMGDAADGAYGMLKRFREAFNALPKDAKVQIKAEIEEGLETRAKAAAKRAEAEFEKVVPKIQPTVDEEGAAAAIRTFVERTQNILRALSGTQRISVFKDAIKNLQEYRKAIEDTSKSLEDRAAAVRRYQGAVQALEKTSNFIGQAQKGEITAKQLESVNSLTTAQYRYAQAQEKSLDAQIEADKANKKNVVSQNKMNDAIGVAIGKLIRYRVAFYVMRSVIDSVRNSIDRFIDTQYQLAGLERIITPLTESIEDYEAAVFQLSKTFGEKVGDIIDTMRVWRQTGLQLEDVKEVTQATLVGVAALGSDTKQVVEALTAAIFTYKVSVEDLTTVISKWLVVQKDFPINAQDIADSLKVVGAAAQVVGVDLDDLAGYVAAVGSATRKSGKAVGQSLKTIFARLPRKEVIQVFESLNIAVLKNATELRDLDNVLDDLSKVWGNLASVQKAQIAIQLGGIRRYSDFIALMDNYEVKVSATVAAQRAQNEALEAAAITQDTFKKAWDRTVASLEQFSVAVGKQIVAPISVLAKSLKVITDALNSASPLVSRIVGGFIAFAASITAATVAGIGLGFLIVKIRRQLLTYALSTTKTREEIEKLTLAELKNAAGKGALASATKNLYTSFNLLQKSAFIISGILSIAVGLWAAFSSEVDSSGFALQDYSDGVKKAYKATLNLIKSNETEVEQLGRLTERLDGLQNRKISFNFTIDDAYKEFSNILQVLPKGNTAIEEAVREVSEGFDKQKVVLDPLIESLKGYSTQLQSTQQDLKSLAEDQKELLVITLKNQINQLRKDQEEIDIIFDDIEARFKDFDPLKFEKIAKVSNTIIPKVDTKQFDFFAALDENIDSGAYAYKRSIKSAYSDVINYAASQAVLLNDFIKESAPDQFDYIKLDPNQIKTFLTTFEKRWDNVLSTFGGISLEEVFSSDDTRDKFRQRLEEEFKQYFPILKSFLDVQTRLANRQNTLSSDIDDRNNQLLELEKETRETDSEFRINQKPPKRVLEFSQAIKDLIENISNLGEEFSVAQVLADRFDFLDPEQFRAEQAKKNIKDIVKELTSARQDLREASEEFADVSKLREYALEAASGGKEAAAANERLADILNSNNLLLDAQFAGEENIPQAILDRYNELNDLINGLKNLINKSDLTDALKRENEILQNLSKKEYDAFLQRLDIDKFYKTRLESLKQTVTIQSAFRKNEEAVFEIQKNITDLNFKYGIATANTILPAQKRREALAKALEEHTEGVAKNLKEAYDFRIDQILEKANKFAGLLEESLTSGFDSIPSDLLEGTEKRKELTRDLSEAEKNLIEARRDGDRQAISDAEYRVALVESEISKYKRGIYEVGRLAENVLGTIGDAFYKGLVEQFAEDVADIKVGDQRLAEVFGQSISKATTTFTSDLTTALATEHSHYVGELRKLFASHATALATVFDKPLSQLPTSLTDPESIINNSSIGSNIGLGQSAQEFRLLSYSVSVLKGIEDNTEATFQEVSTTNKINQGELSGMNKALNSSLTLFANLAAQSIVGTKNRGAQIGTQLGGAVGSNFGQEVLAETIGGTLGTIVGGPIGTLAGSILGGLVGGLFGGDDEPERKLVRSVDALTEATLNNTIALKQLDQSIYNAPTGFNVPTGTGGFGGPVQITINANGATASDIANEVRRVLDGEIVEQFNNTSTRGYVPI